MLGRGLGDGESGRVQGVGWGGLGGRACQTPEQPCGTGRTVGRGDQASHIRKITVLTPGAYLRVPIKKVAFSWRGNGLLGGMSRQHPWEKTSLMRQDIAPSTSAPVGASAAVSAKAALRRGAIVNSAARATNATAHSRRIWLIGLLYSMR